MGHATSLAPASTLPRFTLAPSGTVRGLVNVSRLDSTLQRTPRLLAGVS